MGSRMAALVYGYLQDLANGFDPVCQSLTQADPDGLN